MKNKKTIAMLALLLLIGNSNYTLNAQTSIQDRNKVALMTYNVHNAIGTDGVMDFERIGSVIRNSGAQWVALQELDSVTNRSNGKDVLKEIAANTQLIPTFGGAIRHDGGSYGIGILSKTAPVCVKRIALPGREEKRLMLVAEFKDFVLANVHLSLTEEDRMLSLPIILGEARRWNKPFFLTGDWNAEPQSDFVKTLLKDFTLINDSSQASYPADQPQTCIDYIALFRGHSDKVKELPYIRKSTVINANEASDHRPVYANLQFPIPAQQFFYAPPYLQNPTADGITIMAQTRGTSHCWVEYGTDTLHLQRARTLFGGQAICHDIEHRIRLDNLTAGKRYYYRVCAQEILEYQAYYKKMGQTAKTRFYSFTLPDRQEEDFTALVFNDLHDYAPTIAAWQKICKEIPHDFILFNGDCLTEPHDRDHALSIIHRLTDSFNGAECPIYFVRGNHEIRNAYSAGMPSLLDQPGGKTYGAFNWGDTRFVILDCGEDKPDDHWVYYGLNDFTAFRKEQAEFLKKEMGSKDFRKAKRHILIHHIPIWGNTDKYQPCAKLWKNLLKKGKFDLDCSAHTHEFKWHNTHTIDNPFPIYIGGGPALKEATVGVLKKRGKRMTFEVLNTEGNTIHAAEL